MVGDPVSDTTKMLDEEEGDFNPESQVNTMQSFDEDLGINISFKVKISSSHIQRELELFSIFGDDFFSLVSKFHLPVVRSYYDGSNVYLTPSCISAHLTYMNLDYKYFAGSKDPIEIILKYRMRGFGTFLNKKELNQILNYIVKIPFWNNLYGIKKESNLKADGDNTFGSLDYNHRLYHPRLFNMELYDLNVPYVNINDGYNNVEEREKLTKDKIDTFIKNNLKRSIENESSLGNLDYTKLYTIAADGHINPVKKWLIDSTYNTYKYNYLESLSQVDEIDSTGSSNKLGVVTPWDSLEQFDNSSSDETFNPNIGWDQISSPIIVQDSQQNDNL